MVSNEENGRVIMDVKWIDVNIQGEWMDINGYKFKNHYEYGMNQCQHASKGMNKVF